MCWDAQPRGAAGRGKFRNSGSCGWDVVISVTSNAGVVAVAVGAGGWREGTNICSHPAFPEPLSSTGSREAAAGRDGTIRTEGICSRRVSPSYRREIPLGNTQTSLASHSTTKAKSGENSSGRKMSLQPPPRLLPHSPAGRAWPKPGCFWGSRFCSSSAHSFPAAGVQIHPSRWRRRCRAP